MTAATKIQHRETFETMTVLEFDARQMQEEYDATGGRDSELRARPYCDAGRALCRLQQSDS